MGSPREDQLHAGLLQQRLPLLLLQLLLVRLPQLFWLPGPRLAVGLSVTLDK